MLTFQEIAQRIDEKFQDSEKISLTNFQRLINEVNHPEMATIVSKTIPSRMRKTGNPFWGDCYKIQRLNVVINPSDTGYTDSVNRQRVKEELEPTFEPVPRLFGTKLHNKAFVSHVTKEGEGKFYLWVKSQKVLAVQYQNSAGVLLDKNEVEKFITPGKVESMRQGTDTPTVVRNFDVRNIVGIVIKGRRYVVED